MGDLVGYYWTGMLYYEGKGVEKNIEKSIENLTKAAVLGNSHADHQLFIIYSSDPTYKDVSKAYLSLLEAMENGVTIFADC